jgi:hypothetical protein
MLSSPHLSGERRAAVFSSAAPAKGQGTQKMAERKVTRDDLRQAAEKYKNWGKWGPADEIGTLNYTQPEDIGAAR